MISAMKNKYVIRSKISQNKFREILRLFCEDLEASKISSLTGVSEQCLCRLFRALRLRLVEHSENSSKVCGEIELDESYFGPRRVRGKHGRGAGNKIPVFSFAPVGWAFKAKW